MAKNRAEWASGHRQLTRIGLSDGCGGELIPVAVQSGYHRNKFEGHLGNVGSIHPHRNIASLPSQNRRICVEDHELCGSVIRGQDTSALHDLAQEHGPRTSGQPLGSGFDAKRLVKGGPEQR